MKSVRKTYLPLASDRAGKTTADYGFRDSLKDTLISVPTVQKIEAYPLFRPSSPRRSRSAIQESIYSRMAGNFSRMGMTSPV